MVVSGFQEGAIDYMIEVQYGLSQRADIIVNYTEPTSACARFTHCAACRAWNRLKGFAKCRQSCVLNTDFYRGSLQGIEADSSLMRLLDSDLNLIDLPPQRAWC